MADNPILNKLQASDSIQEDAAVINKAVASQQLDIDQAIAAAQATVTATGVATDAISRAMADAATAQKTTALTEDTAKLQTQQSNIAVYEASGGNEAQIKLMEELVAESRRVEELTDKRADIMDDEHGRGFMSDKIINSFRSYRTNQALRQATAQRDATLKTVSAVTGAQEAFARQNAVATKTYTEGSITARQQQIAAEYTIAAKKNELANLRLNSQATTALIGMKSSQIDNLLKSFNIKDRVEAREVAKAQHEFDIKRMDFEQEQWKTRGPLLKGQLEQLELQLDENRALAPDKRAALQASYGNTVKDYKDELALREQRVTSVQRAQSALGIPIEEAQSIEVGLNAAEGTPTGALYRRLRNIGIRENATFGDTPADALETLDLVDPTGELATGKAAQILDIIRKEQAARLSKPEFSNSAPKDKLGLKKDFNTIAEAAWKGWEADITAGNPLQAPPMQTILPILERADIPLIDKVPSIKAMTEVEPSRVVGAAITGILADAVSPEEAAAGITNIFKAAVAYNNTSEGGFQRLALPAQKSYNVTISKSSFIDQYSDPLLLSAEMLGSVVTFGAIERNYKVDLLDPTQVQNLVVKILSRKGISTATENKEKVQ